MVIVGMSDAPDCSPYGSNPVDDDDFIDDANGEEGTEDHSVTAAEGGADAEESSKESDEDRSNTYLLYFNGDSVEYYVFVTKT